MNVTYVQSYDTILLLDVTVMLIIHNIILLMFIYYNLYKILHYIFITYFIYQYIAKYNFTQFNNTCHLIDILQ